MRQRIVLFFLLVFGLPMVVGGYALASPTWQQNTNIFQQFMFNSRNDLELLADTALGNGARPTSWTGNQDSNSASFLTDLWFDNELLGDAIFGVNTRPEGWFGAVTGANVEALARNIRHDLEISADLAKERLALPDTVQFGVNVRPPEWRGAPPIVRCSRALQNVVDMIGKFYGVRPETPESALDYCRSVEAELEDDLAQVIVTSPEQLEQLPDEILAVRGDLERLADEKLGLNNRPAGWIGNKDRNSASLAADNLLDLESLANETLGQGERPIGWIGAISNQAITSFVNLRHDLELLADATLTQGSRPRGWQGTNPVQRCEPTIQNLYFLVQINYSYQLEGLDGASPTFCDQLSAATSQVAENPPVEDVTEEEGDSKYLAEANWAFAYLDVAATQYMGIMPGGTKFRAWYRNFGESKMIFVSGEDFALYLDYSFTTMLPAIFDSLPTLEGVSPQTFCDAAWCDGPGPTPTPTGYGALQQLVFEITPPSAATPSLGTPGATQKTQVSWNNIRVTYLLDNATLRTAQAALEICVQPAQVATACEPVISVFDVGAGAPRPAISQYNGLNVFEFRYGYSSNLRIEGDTLFSTDIWISDPTIR